jgi:hypothetical protein
MWKVEALQGAVLLFEKTGMFSEPLEPLSVLRFGQRDFLQVDCFRMRLH